MNCTICGTEIKIKILSAPCPDDLQGDSCLLIRK